MIESSVDGLVRSFYEVLWNRWDDGAVEDLLAEDFLFRGSPREETRGRWAWRQYRDTVRAGSADFHNEIVEVVCHGERAAARLQYSGTHTGLLLGLEGTGRRFEYAGAAFFTAEGNQLRSVWVLGDLEGLREQLTWVPR